MSLLGTALMLGVSEIAVNTYLCYPTFISKFGSDVTGNGHSRVVSEWELSLPLLPSCDLFALYFNFGVYVAKYQSTQFKR